MCVHCISFSTFHCFCFFSRQCFSLALESTLELAVVNQAGLELTETFFFFKDIYPYIPSLPATS